MTRMASRFYVTSAASMASAVDPDSPAALTEYRSLRTGILRPGCWVAYENPAMREDDGTYRAGAMDMPLFVTEITDFGGGIVGVILNDGDWEAGADSVSWLDGCGRCGTAQARGDLTRAREHCGSCGDMRICPGCAARHNAAVCAKMAEAGYDPYAVLADPAAGEPHVRLATVNIRVRDHGEIWRRCVPCSDLYQLTGQWTDPDACSPACREAIAARMEHEARQLSQGSSDG